MIKGYGDFGFDYSNDADISWMFAQREIALLGLSQQQLHLILGQSDWGKMRQRLKEQGKDNPSFTEWDP